MVHLLLAIAVAMAPPSEDPYALAPRKAEALLRDAWEAVRDHFYDPNLRGVDWEAALEQSLPEARQATSSAEIHAVINDMLSILHTSHTALLERETYEVLRSELDARKIPQLGFQLEPRREGFFVRVVEEGSAAERAGVRIGDRVAAVDGVPPEESERIFNAGYDPGLDGPPLYFVRPVGDEPVTLTVQRSENPRDLRTVAVAPRRTNAVEAARASVRVDVVDGCRIGFIHLPLLPVSGMDKVLERALLGPFSTCDGLILDLRGRGGHATMGAQILALLDKERTRFRGEVVALIDERTRSGKEVLAHRFRRKRLGTLVGRRTEGAVLGATFHPLADGSVLMIAGVDVTFLSGVNLEGSGVEPDVEVEEPIANYARGRDPILERGVEVLVEKCRRAERRWVWDGPTRLDLLCACR